MSITIHKDQVLKQIGYKSLPEEKVLTLLDEMLELGNKQISPLMKFKKIGCSGEFHPFFHGAALGYFALVSIGPELENQVKAFFDLGKAMEGYILDVVGTVAVKQAGNALWAEIIEDASLRGFKKGFRRAPGCKGVPMPLQKRIIDMLQEPDPGVRVTSSYMLVPRKSFAFLGRFGGKLEGSFSCEGCPQFSTCDLRR
ncbi:MAG: hypothetical protein JW836_12925 [Deltaproteobacteria bacterium]|nr:hypothetical protein [Deltaproteobacteria bacterium]